MNQASPTSAAAAIAHRRTLRLDRVAVLWELVVGDELLGDGRADGDNSSHCCGNGATTVAAENGGGANAGCGCLGVGFKAVMMFLLLKSQSQKQVVQQSVSSQTVVTAQNVK